MSENTADNPPLSAHQLDMIVGRIDQLPTLPAVAARILNLTSNETSSADEVVRLIEQDQSLTARVLRLVGRARGGQRVSTVKAAVVVIGFKAVRTAVLSVKVFDAFRHDKNTCKSAFDRAGFWRHCLAVATASQLLAQARGGLDAEEAFAAGLMHDIGKVVLDVCLPKTFDRVIRLVRGGRHSISDAEQRLLGVDHATVGRRLAEKWKLPPMLAECIWLHHHPPGTLPDATRHREMVELVHVADAMAREQRIGFSGNRRFLRPAVELAGQIGVSRAKFARIRDRLCEETAARATGLGLDRANASRLYREALSDANQELGRMAEDLRELNVRTRLQNRRFDLMAWMHEQAAVAESVGDTLEVIGKAVQQCLGGGEVCCYAWYETEKLVQLATVKEEGPRRLETISVDHEQMNPTVGFVPMDARMADAWFFEHVGVTGDMPYLSLPLAEGLVKVGGVIFSYSGSGSDALTEDRLLELKTLVSSATNLLRRAQIAEETNRLAEALAVSQRNVLETQEQLLCVRTMAGVGEMAAGAAHEINNPLAIISGRAQLLAAAAGDDKQSKALKTIIEQTERASAIISELMRFAEPEAPKGIRFDVRQLLAERLDHFEDVHEKSLVKIRRRLPKKLPDAFADVQQIGTVFDAVLTNASEAVAQDGGGRIEIRVQHNKLESTLGIVVEDNGPGLPSGVLGRAFDPFFSAKGAGRQLGLGLTIAFRLIELNFGRIELGNGENGALVTLTIPVAE